MLAKVCDSHPELTVQDLQWNTILALFSPQQRITQNSSGVHWFRRLASQYASERFVKNETLRLLDTTEAGYYWP
jgi:hypothetical protein